MDDMDKKKCSKLTHRSKISTWVRGKVGCLGRKGMQREDGKFNVCSKLVKTYEASGHVYESTNTHSFPAFTILCGSGEFTSKYLITGNLIRFPL